MRLKIMVPAVVASVLWLIVSGAWGMQLMAHGGNAAILRFIACKKEAPDNIAGCEARFKKDFDAEVDYRWFLVAAQSFGPLAAAWLLGFGVAAINRRRNMR